MSQSKRHDWMGGQAIQFCANLECRWQRTAKIKGGRKVGAWHYRWSKDGSEHALPFEPTCGKAP